MYLPALLLDMHRLDLDKRAIQKAPFSANALLFDLTAIAFHTILV